jgi:hypothetical protein
MAIFRFEIKPEPWKRNPWKFLAEDLIWFLRHPYDIVVEFILRNTIFAVRFQRVRDDEPTSELNLLYWRNWISVFNQVVLFFITLPIIILYPLMMVLALEAGVIRHPARQTNVEEKWFFINGVLVNEDWLEGNCRYLEERFNTGVTGILNRSYGIFWDIVKAIFERSFNIDTI